MDEIQRDHLNSPLDGMSQHERRIIIGRVVWYENLTKYPKAAIAFYTEVVGWKTQPFGEGGDYVMWVGSRVPLGGVPDEAAKMGTPPNWIAHVQVEDVDATVSLVKSLEGKVYKDPQESQGEIPLSVRWNKQMHLGHCSPFMRRRI
jgi:predicted enzyme related to lactoylglutathione lyase